MGGEENALLDLVKNQGPTVIAIYVNSYFQSYKSGIFNDPTCNLYPNHALIVVGYGTLNGTDYWWENWNSHLFNDEF